MAMATESQTLPQLLSESRPSLERERVEDLVAKLVRFYSVMGNRPDEPGALALMAEILCQSGTEEQIARAMTRCTRECRYPVRLPDLLQRIPGQEIPAPDAEGRCAWGELMKFVKKYVGNDVYGNYGPQHGWYPKTYPQLSDRIRDTVRRTGDWGVYARMSDEDFPFVQKRFFEEYGAWAAVEKVDASKLLAELPQLRLVAKPIDRPRKMEPQSASATSSTFNAKPIPEPMSDGRLRDRRQVLRQQAAAYRNRQKQEI